MAVFATVAALCFSCFRLHPPLTRRWGLAALRPVDLGNGGSTPQRTQLLEQHRSMQQQFQHATYLQKLLQGQMDCITTLCSALQEIMPVIPSETRASLASTVASAARLHSELTGQSKHILDRPVEPPALLPLGPVSEVMSFDHQAEVRFFFCVLMHAGLFL